MQGYVREVYKYFNFQYNFILNCRDMIVSHKLKIRNQEKENKHANT